MKPIKFCFVITLFFAFFATPFSAAESPAYTVAAGEAGQLLPENDPRIKKIDAALAKAAKIFHATKDEIAEMAYNYASGSREKGFPLTTLEILTSAPAFHQRSPKIVTSDLAGFKEHCKILVESARFAHLATEINAANALVKFDVGNDASGGVAEIDAAIAVLREAVQLYHTKASVIAAAALNSGKEARKAGVKISPLALIKASIRAGKKEPRSLNFVNFMIFSSGYAQASINAAR